jgi:hypothetical protein
VAEQFSPLVAFEISPVFVTAYHPGHARDGRRARRIAEAPPSGGRKDLVIKLGELVMILDLHRQGLSVSAIARQVGVDRKTVRTHIGTAESFRGGEMVIARGDRPNSWHRLGASLVLASDFLLARSVLVSHRGDGIRCGACSI